MKLASDKSHSAAEVGDYVTITIPNIDRAKSDLRNILGIGIANNDDAL